MASTTTNISRKLNVDAPAWTPSLTMTGGVHGLTDLSLPETNHSNGVASYPTNTTYNNNSGDDEHADYDDEVAELNDYYEDEFVTDHTEYEMNDQTSDWHQQDQWSMMMEHQPAGFGGFSNAAAQSGGGGVGFGMPPPPASLFPGGKMPQTTEEWEIFNAELRERQKKQIERQAEERKAREETRRLQEGKGPNKANFGGNSYANAPLTVNGKHRWPKNTAAKKAEVAQKAAFESFANALLHAVSPFMGPLRKLTRTSLPHIKMDQRFGRRGQPETAVMQFIIAPVVINYKPAHFHEVSPGDLMEFHYDFALVLNQLRTANSIAFSYGPSWKPFQLPYCFVGCREYAKEVRRLCPDEVPNGRSEAVYEDDVVKDITAVICAVQELEPLSRMSIADAMKARVNLVSMYDVFNALFGQIGDYQIQIRNLNSVPSQYLLKTSMQVLAKSCDLKPQYKCLVDNNSDEASLSPHCYSVSIGGDDTVWDDLPTVANTFQSGKTVVVSVDPEEVSKKNAPISLIVARTPEKLISQSQPIGIAPPVVSSRSNQAHGQHSSVPLSSAAPRHISPSSATPVAPVKKERRSVRVSGGTAAVVVCACVAVTALTASLFIKRK